MSSEAKTPTALVSIAGPDRVGLISAVAGRLFDLGANLGDTAFAVLGGNAEFTAVCELLGEKDLGEIKNALSELEQLAGADVSVTVFDVKTHSPASESITHTISISGGDKPGLLARLCEVFEQFNANVVQLHSEQVTGADGGHYVISAAVAIPEESQKSCLAHVSNTAGELGLECEINEIG